MFPADLVDMQSQPEGHVPLDGPATDLGVVMLVDDSVDVHQLVTDDLAGDYKVVAMASGREALQQLRNGLRPHVIILDLLMPEMDGLEFLDAVRADPNLTNLPVIIISALSVPVRLQRRDATYLSKPYRPMQLQDAVRGLIAKSRDLAAQL
jgi:CheY-like chemotaxis protein